MPLIEGKRCKLCGAKPRKHGIYMWAIHRAVWKQKKAIELMKRKGIV